MLDITAGKRGPNNWELDSKGAAARLSGFSSEDWRELCRQRRNDVTRGTEGPASIEKCPSKARVTSAAGWA